MTNEKILAEARDRFKKCQNFESQARNNWRADMRFGYGDSVNLYQWQSDTIDSRTASGKPCFTVNRTKNYCMQIVNDAKQNKAAVEVRAVGGGASFKAAEVLEGIVRHIEYISNAEAAYEQASHDQVFGGIGYWRIITDYSHDDSFDQEIYIRPIKDALSVYLDPYIQQADGSDAMFGFVFTTMDKKDFEKAFPRHKDAIGDLPFSMENDADDLKLREDRVRVCEYFRKTFEPDTLHYLQDGSTVKESVIEEMGLKDKLDELSVKQRDISVAKVEWYLIAGDKIVNQSTFPSQYIPIVRCVGQETLIDGVLDRIGHVRSLIDPQRSYNYYTSAGIEFVATQTKSPWLADVASIEGMEEYWRDANLKNYAVLPYKGRGDDGNEIEPPHRADPPTYASAFLDGMKVSASEMELTSAQPPASMGDTSNERSGKAVLERQRAAANSTYHFVNNLSSAIRHTGKILIDMIPRVYDTERTMKILAQDGSMQTVKLDPTAQQAHTPMPALDPESIDPQQIAAVLNPSVGEYDVVAEVGPQYATRRQEFVAATMDILAQNESLTPLIGDLVFANMDFPGAQEIAERMRRMVPPQATGVVDPQVEQLQKLLAQQHQLLQQMAQELQHAKWRTESIGYQKSIDAYEAETKRMEAVGKIDPMSLRPLIREMVSEMLGLPANAAIAMHMREDAQMQKETELIDRQIEEAMQPQQPPTPQ